MISKTLIVRNRFGIHMRAASALVRLSRSFQSRITIERGGILASAGSIMEILLLAAGRGNRILVTVAGNDEREALAAVETFMGANVTGEQP